MFADIPVALLMWSWTEPDPAHKMMRLQTPAHPDWQVLEHKFPNCPLTIELKLWVCEIEQKIWFLHQGADQAWWLSSLDATAKVTTPPPINIGLKPFGYGRQQGYQYWLFIEPVGRVAIQRQLEFRLSQLKRQRISVDDTQELIRIPALSSLLSIYNYRQWTVLIWLKTH